MSFSFKPGTAGPLLAAAALALAIPAFGQSATATTPSAPTAVTSPAAPAASATAMPKAPAAADTMKNTAAAPSATAEPKAKTAQTEVTPVKHHKAKTQKVAKNMTDAKPSAAPATGATTVK